MGEKANLHAEIYARCEKGDTGTMYMTTVDNKGCYLVIEEGEIKALSMGRLMGDDFIKDFAMLLVKTYSFKQNIIMPLSSKANISSSYDFLGFLGYEMPVSLVAKRMQAIEVEVDHSGRNQESPRGNNNEAYFEKKRKIANGFDGLALIRES